LQGGEEGNLRARRALSSPEEQAPTARKTWIHELSTACGVLVGDGRRALAVVTTAAAAERGGDAEAEAAERVRRTEW